MRYRRVEGHNDTSDHRELCIALTLAEKACGHHTQCYPNNKGSHTQWVLVLVYLRIVRYFCKLTHITQEYVDRVVMCNTVECLRIAARSFFVHMHVLLLEQSWSLQSASDG